MTDHKEEETATIHQVPNQPTNNTITFRIPKPNMQLTILGIVAAITLFQTYQLVRVSGAANSVPAAAAAPAATTSTGSTGTGSNAGVPQSQVGGC